MGERSAQTSRQRTHRCQMSMLKLCSTTFVIRELQIKTTMRYYYTLIRTANIQKPDNTDCWQERRATKPLIHEFQMGQPCWSTVCQFFTKLDTVSPYTPAILILGIYTTDWATYKHLYTQLLTDADESFIHNLQNRKQ